MANRLIFCVVGAEQGCFHALSFSKPVRSWTVRLWDSDKSCVESTATGSPATWNLFSDTRRSKRFVVGQSGCGTLTDFRRWDRSWTVPFLDFEKKKRN